jgi:hypothetical protein
VQGTWKFLPVSWLLNILVKNQIQWKTMEIFLLFFLFSQFFGILSSVIASFKGYNIYGWFIIGMVLGPIGVMFAFFMKRTELNVVKKYFH